MKNSHILFMLLMSTHYSGITIDDNPKINEKIKQIADKLHDSAHRTADWFEHYRKACMHNLDDWVENCRNVIKNDAAAFRDFMIDEKDAAFQKLSNAEQKAIRDINKFYQNMASATRKEQEELVKKFSDRWKECQRIFDKGTHKTIDDMKTCKKHLDSLTRKLEQSVRSTQDWIEYYADACRYDLEDWIEYYRGKTQDNSQLFKAFIQNESSAAFKKLDKHQQKAIKDLNHFFKEMSTANKEKQDKLVEKFAHKWNEYQYIFQK